jgi:hypothetical protein
VTDEPVIRVEHACHHLISTGQTVTFDKIAEYTGIARSTLYRRPELRAIIEQHRHHGGDALTLTGLQVQIDQLRRALAAVAATTRHNDEELRKRLRDNRSR